MLKNRYDCYGTITLFQVAVFHFLQERQRICVILLCHPIPLPMVQFVFVATSSRPRLDCGSSGSHSILAFTQLSITLFPLLLALCDHSLLLEDSQMTPFLYN